MKNKKSRSKSVKGLFPKHPRKERGLYMNRLRNHSSKKPEKSFIYEREKEIEKVFGSYGDEVSMDVLRYMRKNPDKIIKRLYKVYGNKLYDYLEQARLDNNKC